MHKYNARAVSINGLRFDSQAEANRYFELRLLEQAGEITDLKLQPAFVLQEAFTDDQGRRHRAITYRADFQYREGGETVVEDVKGHRTQVYRIKKKLFLKRYPGLEFREITL